MKTLFISAFSILFLTVSINAQRAGVIEYTENMKMDIQFEGMPDMDISELLPDSRSVIKELTFNGNHSIYTEGSESPEDTEINSDDGSIKIVMMSDDTENILFIDHQNKTLVDQKGFMGKSFLVKGDLPKSKWKITPEKVKYLGYECIKATRTNEDDKIVVAWFTPAIPVSIGPGSYGQLPGAILMLSVDGDKFEVKARKIELKDVGEISAPHEGKIVSNDEYEKIMEEKMKEMEMQYGGKGHGTVIRIGG